MFVQVLTYCVFKVISPASCGAFCLKSYIGIHTLSPKYPVKHPVLSKKGLKSYTLLIPFIALAPTILNRYLAPSKKSAFRVSFVLSFTKSPVLLVSQ